MYWHKEIFSVFCVNVAILHKQKLAMSLNWMMMMAWPVMWALDHMSSHVMPHHIWPARWRQSFGRRLSAVISWLELSAQGAAVLTTLRAAAAVSTMTCQLLRRLSLKVSVTHHHPNSSSSSFRNDEMSWLTTPLPCDRVVIVRWVLHQLGLKTQQQKPVFWKIEAVGGVLSDENWNWSGLITHSPLCWVKSKAWITSKVKEAERGSGVFSAAASWGVQPGLETGWNELKSVWNGVT